MGRIPLIWAHSGRVSAFPGDLLLQLSPSHTLSCDLDTAEGSVHIALSSWRLCRVCSALNLNNHVEPSSKYVMSKFFAHGVSATYMNKTVAVCCQQNTRSTRPNKKTLEAQELNIHQTEDDEGGLRLYPEALGQFLLGRTCSVLRDHEILPEKELHWSLWLRLVS